MSLPAVVVDHVIVCCDAGGPEAGALANYFTEGSSNTHVGQGTANRRFFFHNAYLELLWVDDMAAAKREPARRTRLWERWSRRRDGACPFGIAFRPAVPGEPGEPDAPPPFPTWAYHPPYLLPQLSIGIGVATPLREPDALYLSFATPPAAKNLEPLTHPSRVERLTAVRVGLPNESVESTGARAVQAAGLVGFYDAGGYAMELTFDDGAAGKSVDLRPALPLLLRW